MDTKQYLNQIERLEKMIQNKLGEIHRLRLMSCNVTVSNENERVQTSGEKDKVGAVVSKIIDMESEVDSMIDKRCHIVWQIESIQDTNLYDVLAKRYILGRTNKEIAAERDEAQETTCRILREAHTEFEKMYGKEYLTIQCQ